MEHPQHGDQGSSARGHHPDHSPGTGQSPAKAQALFTAQDWAQPVIRFVVIVAGGSKGITKARAGECLAALKRKHKSIAIWHAGSDEDESPARKIVRDWAARNKVPWVPFSKSTLTLMRCAKERMELGQKTGVMILPTSNPQTILSASKAAGLPAWEI